ncbi:MAG: sulfotransferase [Dehalococcoidia bacterium]
MTKPRIVFIAGVGRSGSTLMDRILGQTPGVVSVGEIYRFWVHRYLSRAWCSCGSLVSACPFWGRVATHLEAAGQPDAAFEDATQWDVVRLRNAEIFPWQPWRTKSYAKQRDHVVESWSRLYEAIAEAGEGRVIVDSTKIPRFALAMAASKRFDLRVVHLVRDSRASAYSWIRPKPAPSPDNPEQMMKARQPHQTCAWWLVANPLSELLRLKSQPYLRVRYEDFVRDPMTWSSKILDFAGVSARPEGLEASAVTFTGDHLIAGNPIRSRLGHVEIRPDEEWRTKMRGRDRLVATVMTWPMLLRYRYPLWPRAGR